MKKYRVYINREVYETLELEVEANDEDEAEEIAEQMSCEEDPREWYSETKAINFDVEEIKE